MTPPFSFMQNKFIWFVFFVLLSITSYIREVLFRSVNAIIKGEDQFYAKTTSLPLLLDWSKADLIKLKYGMTVGFTVVFIALTTLGILFSMKNKIWFTLSKWIYVIIVAIAMVIFIYGFIFSDFRSIYPNLRLIIGWIHNPLLFLFISVAAISYSATIERAELK